ncbi:striatin isoform X3 [Aphidius gifuensis]|uniref:striatin isoform X3 n=1 Tax=Aphidius gifuensis TaxID=684658 RepID=UPI001CDBF451|nr:striatin isoform X3 [Aphidius gifuensis]
MKVPSQFCDPIMEENSSSVSQNHNGPLSSGVNVSVANDKHQNSDNSSGNGGKDQKSQYSMPGILHFIQHEWARFELDRSQWELDRAEFQARIAFLQGERKAQENLKNDLVRRIKMLEYALKQERAKCHILKYGTDLVIQDDVKQPLYEESGTVGGSEGDVGDGEAPFTSVSNITWKEGRQLLREYLQEIGYTDTIIDVRSNRVRSLLGLNNITNSEDINTPASNGNETSNKRSWENQGRRTSKKVEQQPTSIAEAMILDTEASVMANFEFLAHTDIDMEEEEVEVEEALYETDGDIKSNKTSMILGEDVDAEAEEVLNELNLLTEAEESLPGSIIHVDVDSNKWNNAMRRSMQPDTQRSGEEGDSALGLGELAQLTVNNDAEMAATKETFRKTWNAKYTLRSHFDCVRSLVFHPTDPVLITASDDHTLKLWNLQKTVPAKKSASLDVEPLYTFRSHTGPVLCLAMCNTGSRCYSGGIDGKIHCWSVPSGNIDPYDSYEPGILGQSLSGHTDAVWGLSMYHPKSQLLSVSADGTVKLWNSQSKVPLLNTYASEQDGIPTSVDFVRDECHKLVVAYEGACVVFDAETGSIVSRLEGHGTKGVNRVVAHPIQPLIIAAYEDRHIRFYDHRSATLAHAMVAHLDAVTSLAVDPHGLYLLSGSHDCSIRLWNMDNKTCVQEITAHRKKFDESILDVAFHPSLPFIASAGADALAKVFV